MKLVLSASMGLYCDHVTSIVTEPLASMRLYCHREARIFGYNEAVL